MMMISNLVVGGVGVTIVIFWTQMFFLQKKSMYSLYNYL
jgi:hypothetical protein